jgi:hypothetical protein
LSTAIDRGALDPSQLETLLVHLRVLSNRQMDRVSDVYSHLLCILVVEYQGNAVVPSSAATDSDQTFTHTCQTIRILNEWPLDASPPFG